MYRPEGRRHGRGEKLLGGALRQVVPEKRMEEPAQDESGGEHPQVK